MSDNICTTSRLHVNAYVKTSGMFLQPPRILDRKLREPTNDLARSEMFYSISDDEGTSVDLVGWEAVLITIAILRDALHRERILKSIRKPSPEQLDELRTVIDKLEYLLPHETE